MTLGVIDEVARAHFGATSADAVARSVADVSQAYTRRRDRLDRLEHDARALEARLRFFLPRDLPKIELPLEELRWATALPEGPAWRVLDLGAGLGASTLGVARFARRTGAAERLQVVAVDRDRRALSLLAELAARSTELGGVPIELETRAVDATRPADTHLAGRHDLVLAGLVLNELVGDRGDDAAQAETALGWVRRWAEALQPEGALVVLEPALRECARRLQRVRDRLFDEAGPPHVFAPCLRAGPCPMLPRERDWCHTDLPGALAAPLAAIARRAGLREARRTFSHLTLRLRPGDLRMAAAGVPGAPYRVVSSLMRSKGKVEAVLCGEPGLVRLARLTREASEPNAAVEGLRRGALVTVPDRPPLAGRLRVGPDDPVHRIGDPAGPAD